MKSTGMIRCVDELGRIVLPKSIRQNLEIADRDQIEIFIDGDRIVLQKFHPSCIFCSGEAQDVIVYKGKRICGQCLAVMKRMDLGI